MKTYCLVSAKPWHDELFKNLSSREDEKWIKISEKDDFSLKNLKKENVLKVFIPHWSHIIGSDVYSNVECVVFHMTDLPYGRGGSPLQNLIVRGHKETKISAIRVSQGVDTGDVYLKKPLSLEGSAEEIFLRSVPIIEVMISEMIDGNIMAHPQVGDIVEFKRRKPGDGDLSKLVYLNDIYDYIRMLDCQGYPPAYLESKSFKFDFSNASLNTDGSVTANVRIIQK